MPEIPTFECLITNASEEDLNQWASHHLSNQFHVWSWGKKYDHQRNEVVTDQLWIKVYGNKDRFRLRDSYDIAQTKFGTTFISAEKYVDK